MGLRIHPRNEWKIYQNLNTRREGHIVLKFELKNISTGFIENKKIMFMSYDTWDRVIKGSDSNLNEKLFL